jgi:hypothetical protein
MFLLIALLCAPSVEITDSLEGVYIADSTLLLQSLTPAELKQLDKARIKEYRRVKWAYRHYSYPTWEAQMTLWLKHTYDSLRIEGKNPWNLYYVLPHKNIMSRWLRAKTDKEFDRCFNEWANMRAQCGKYITPDYPTEGCLP